MTREPDSTRRSLRARSAILQAALALCREVGFAKLTIEAIAERAGVGKQTIYRWWPSKGAVVLEALNEYAGEVADFPDTGDVIADLRQPMTGVAGLFSSPDFVPVYTGVIAAAQSDPDLAQTLLDTTVMPRIASCRRRLERAQQQGEIRADADLNTIVELLYGGLYHRLLLRTRPPSPEQVATILDLVFDGLRPSQTAAATADSR